MKKFGKMGNLLLKRPGKYIVHLGHSEIIGEDRASRGWGVIGPELRVS